MKSLVAQDYIPLKIDTDEMIHGADVAKRLRKGKGGGIPWMVVLDGEGAELVNSDGPKGNIGCPVQPHEVDWFMTMIARTAVNLDEQEQAALRELLEAFAKPLRRG